MHLEITIGPLILFLLATIGMTHIVVHGSIFEGVRNWLEKKLPSKIYEVFTCYQCSGTWCGFICGAMLVSLNPFVVFCCGCAGSFVAALANQVMEYIETKTVIDIEDINRLVGAERE